MERNQGIQEYLSTLSATPETNYSLWKATKRLKRPQTQPIRKQDRNWVRSEKEKAEIFAEYLFKVFKLNLTEITQEKENRLLSDDIIPATQDTPTRSFTVNEVKTIIKHLNPKKTPVYDFIINKVLQKLPEVIRE